jgi:hypothetical protein
MGSTRPARFFTDFPQAVLRRRMSVAGYREVPALRPHRALPTFVGQGFA